MDTTREPILYRRMGLSLMAFALGVGLLIAFASHRVEMLWRAYLFGLVSCWLVAMGAAGILAIGNLTGGRWAVAGRPFYLAAMKTIPLVTVLFVPLGFALSQIYPWAEMTGAERAEHFINGKAIYLSPAFFLIRAVIYLAIFNVVAWWLASVSRLDVPPGRTFRMRRAGAVSLVLLAPSVTFAAFDWVMSLEPDWYSSIFGAMLTMGGVAAAHALTIYGLARMPRGLRERVMALPTEHDHHDSPNELFADMGNLLLAFIMVWTYFSFSQYLIIWSGNLPSEISWYLVRSSGYWLYLISAVFAMCFVLPFFALLSRDTKRSIWPLAMVALIVLAGYGLNMYWTMVPALRPIEPGDHLACASALLTLGGLWSAVNSWQLGNVLRTGALVRPGDEFEEE